jgi:hypothetical protein
VPHVELFCEPVATQVFPEQHPLGHDAALHTQAPATHAWPLPQVEQERPPAPQAADPPPVWQRPIESQHPVGHVAALHAPHVCVVRLQSRPLPQSLFALQPHTPPVMHA